MLNVLVGQESEFLRLTHREGISVDKGGTRYYWLRLHPNGTDNCKNEFDAEGHLRCLTCNASSLYEKTIKHDHAYTGTHYVCSAHNYVGTSQLH